MEHRGGNLATHALPEGQLAHRDVEQALEIEQNDELVASSAISVGRDAIDVAQQVEAFDDGEIPPQLRPLAEDRADAGNVADALAPRHQTADDTSPGRRLENPAEDLDRRRFACTVGPDQAEQLAFGECEVDAFERVDRAPAATHDATERAKNSGGPLCHPE